MYGILDLNQGSVLYVRYKHETNLYEDTKPFNVNEYEMFCVPWNLPAHLSLNTSHPISQTHFNSCEEIDVITLIGLCVCVVFFPAWLNEFLIGIELIRI